MSLRIIDELPDQIVSQLLSNGEMKFAPVPEPTHAELIRVGYLLVDPKSGQERTIKKGPTPEEWASQCGLSASYEVPESSDTSAAPSKHQDKVLQTLLFPDNLEARLRNLTQKSNSAIQEMGTNILYLVVGFLEWYESKDSDASNLAPLFLVPVNLRKGKLNRRTGNYEYVISYSGEDLVPNLSLREKLRIDFSLELPDLDDEATPESYLQAINTLVRTHQPRWRIRRYITLTLLNFNKLLMYLDLDPSRWPRNRQICDHSVVKNLMGVGTDESLAAGAIWFEDEYQVDALEDVHNKYPLILDADSSQHSALKDAIDGRSLVIEGPPGTGKSQTIANIIAAAISQGKSVLFVAEKLAALEVVKRKLDSVGLGDFCLELHSHKTQKRLLLDNLAARNKKRGRYIAPQEIHNRIKHYESYRERLQRYAEAINSEFLNTGMTAHQILTGATRHARDLGKQPSRFHPEEFAAEKFSIQEFENYDDAIRSFIAGVSTVRRQLLDKGLTLEHHPWQGIKNDRLQVFDAERVERLASDWLRALVATKESVNRFVSEHGLEAATQGYEKATIARLVTDIQSLPTEADEGLIGCLPTLLKGGSPGVRYFLTLAKDVEALQRRLDGRFEPKVLNATQVADVLFPAVSELEKIFPPDATFEKVLRGRQLLKALLTGIEEIVDPLKLACELVSDQDGVAGKFSIGTLRSILSFYGQIKALDPGQYEYRTDLLDNDELDSALPELQDELNALRDLRHGLESVFRMESLPRDTELELIEQATAGASVFGLLRRDFRSARKALLGIRAKKETRLKELLEALPAAREFSGRLELLRRNEAYPKLLGKLFQGVETEIDRIVELRRWYGGVRDAFGRGFGPTSSIGDAILDLSPEQLSAFGLFARKGVTDHLEKLISVYGELKAIFGKQIVFQREAEQLSGPDSKVTRLWEETKSALTRLSVIDIDLAESVESLCERVGLLKKLDKTISSIKTLNIESTVFDNRVQCDWSQRSNNKEVLSRVEQVLRLAELLEDEVSSELVVAQLCRTPSNAGLSELHEYGSELSKLLDNCSSAETAFCELTHLDARNWQQSDGSSMEAIIGRLRTALNYADLLGGWLDYVRSRYVLENLGFLELVRQVESGDLPNDQAQVAARAAVFSLLSREIFDAYPEVSQFAGYSHNECQKRFKEIDRELIKLQSAMIAYKADQRSVPAGVCSGKVGQFTDLHLINWEIQKKQQHIPIRKLVQRAGDALLGLKPCFMMGPMSVAQYINPASIEFDLLVMDEASQVKPEDAIGSMGRASQIVIVGDPKQLPPTSFFDKIEQVDEDEATAVEASESILDAAITQLPARRLRWHYRSQHENLIAFSNHSFYDGNLVIFPSPHHESKALGLKLTRVKNGRFLTRRNLEEARIIAEAVRRHMLSSSQESLGVVTMSADQRDQVECAIEELAKADRGFSEKLEGDRANLEPLFVKNLENVQGDERDIILISMTYGPDERGVVMQRFGPINSDVGWRRLNVLFTRSRRRMHVFSSMGSNDIRVSESSHRGVRELKHFLSYAESGLLYESGIETGRQPDSDFEVAVAKALKQSGYQCVPQVGAAGFYIDLAVRDPGNSSRYLMGIECDGATYHSAKSARDRDRLRQEILENLGWNIKRVWSTDWFKDSEQVLKELLSELEILCKTPEPEYVGTTDVEVEDIEYEEAHPLEELTLDVGDDLNIGEAFQELAQVIKARFPDTAENMRLLRPAMVEALTEFLPTNSWEFQERIPQYLRTATSVDEARIFLPMLFELVESYV